MKIYKRKMAMIIGIIFLCCNIFIFNSLMVNAKDVKLPKPKITGLSQSYKSGSVVGIGISTQYSTSMVQYKVSYMEMKTKKEAPIIKNYTSPVNGNSLYKLRFSVKNSGTYILKVYVRRVGKSVAYEGYSQGIFKIIDNKAVVNKSDGNKDQDDKEGLEKAEAEKAAGESAKADSEKANQNQVKNDNQPSGGTINLIADADGIKLDLEAAAMKVGDYFDITESANKDLTWNSSDNSVVSIENGRITGLKIGHASITVASSNGKSDTVDIAVIDGDFTYRIDNINDGFSFKIHSNIQNDNITVKITDSISGSVRYLYQETLNGNTTQFTLPLKMGTFNINVKGLQTDKAIKTTGRIHN